MGLDKLPWFERVALGASGVTLVVALVSWELMCFGLYSLERMALGAGAVVVPTAAVAWWLARRRAPSALEAAPGERRDGAIAVVAGLLCVGFGLLYAGYPTYFLLGGQDPGPYLAFAARIAKTGGLHLAIPELAEWAAAHPGMLATYPAIFGDLGGATSAPPLQAQFLHLYTALLANFFALGGVAAAVRANAWLSVLCLALGFALVRRLGSPLAALAFVVVLGVNPAFIWASRITLTETLALFLNLGGLLLLVVAWDLGAAGVGTRGSAAVGALAGAVLGVGVLNRLDGGLGALAVVGLALASPWGGLPRRAAVAGAALGNLVVSSLALVNDYRVAPVYCATQAGISVATSLLPAVPGTLDALALLVALVPARLSGLVTRESARQRRLIVTGVLGALGLGAYFVLRRAGGSADDPRAFSELTWYVGRVTWPLAAVGVVTVASAGALGPGVALVTFALGTLAIYTLRTYVAPEHIWASRRWVQHVIPLALATAVLGAEAVVHWLRSHVVGPIGPFGPRAVLAIVLGSIAAAYFTPALRFDDPFLTQSMLEGLPAAYERAAAEAQKWRSRWPLVAANPQLGSILSYVYDVPTVVLTPAGIEAFERGALEGSVGVGLDAFDLHDKDAVPIRYAGPYLERTDRHRPRELYEQRLTLDVGEIGAATYDLIVPASHPSLLTHIGYRQGGEMKSSGEPGALLFGPAMTLLPGRYRIEWYGHAGQLGHHKEPVVFDIVFDRGALSLGEARFAPARPLAEDQLLAGLDLTVTQRRKEADFRVRVGQGVELTISRVRIQRFGEL